MQLKTIAEIDKYFEKAHSVVLESEKDTLTEYQQMDKKAFSALPEKLQQTINSGKSGGFFYNAVGMIRIALFIVNPEFINTAGRIWNRDKETMEETQVRYSKYRNKLAKENTM